MDIIALLEEVIKGIYEAQKDYFEEPKDLYGFEKKVTEVFRKGAAGFIGLTLSEADKLIEESAYRKMNYKVQRHDERTLITTAGEVRFRNTLYLREEDGKYEHLLSRMMCLRDKERLSEGAEAELIKEAIKTSYERASLVLPLKSGITKTTVMNKIHRIEESLPEEGQSEKKKARYLYIEADEDHLSEQHGRYLKKDKGSFISRLAYVYEGKRLVCEGKKELIGSRHFGGLYEGSEGISRFWDEIYRYIDSHYDYESIERIYISGDGASWIKRGCEHIPKSVSVLDKFHLTKYINRGCDQMLDESAGCRADIYRMLYKRKKKDFRGYTDRMMESAPDTEKVRELQSYVLNNWEGIMTLLHDEAFLGCSAEGHVSHVLSDRMSSRPMGWSKLGADRMSRLRCYVKDHGEGKIIDLVKYQREQRIFKKTGTDDVEIPKLKRSQVTAEGYNIGRSYIERLQATIPGYTAKKSIAIREQFRLI